MDGPSGIGLVARLNSVVRSSGAPSSADLRAGDGHDPAEEPSGRSGGEPFQSDSLADDVDVHSI